MTKITPFNQNTFCWNIFIWIGIAAMFIACGEHSHSHDHDATGPEYASAYVCPMHCEGSGADAPGKCPKCSMDYVANEGYEGAANEEGAEAMSSETDGTEEGNVETDGTEETEGHDHDGHDHDHSHGESEGHDHDGGDNDGGN